MIFGKPREKRAEEEVTFGLCFVSSIIKLSTIVIIQVCLPKKIKKEEWNKEISLNLIFSFSSVERDLDFWKI